MPAADLAMQRNVPTRLIWMMRLNASSGKCLISRVVLSRRAVLIALPVPAQLTRMRSWPSAARALAKPASTSASEVTSTLQNTPPISLRERFALLGVEVEDRDLDAVRRERARRRRAEAGGAAGDDGGDARIEFHVSFSTVPLSTIVTLARPPPSHMVCRP